MFDIMETIFVNPIKINIAETFSFLIVFCDGATVIQSFKANNINKLI